MDVPIDVNNPAVQQIAGAKRFPEFEFLGKRGAKSKMVKK
jgi:hypothetical protein